MHHLVLLTGLIDPYYMEQEKTRQALYLNIHCLILTSVKWEYLFF